MEKNVLLTVEYDGSGFHGWQEQPGVRTVQGELQKALSVVCRRQIKVAGTSRTDAGVHALGQCCSFCADIGIPTERIPPAVNNMLAGGRSGLGVRAADVRVVSAVDTAPGFHARANCAGKMYRYVICRGVPDVFRRNYCYFVGERLDIAAMREAARYVEGRHDFAAFRSAGGSPCHTTVRTVFSVDIRESGDDLIIEVSGDGFLYNMVRIIVGTLVETGMGKRRPGDMELTVASGERRTAGHTAPAEGLYLAKIWFDDRDKEERSV